ncbi:GFA family protein [Massilia sp. TSP1-1-2]|uniref:GFA family protein n=1 Tax=unclassified Massilia TaxID=2609279 RepID=UPI003CF35C17
MRKTYHGSCHCKAVRFEADIDLSLGTLRCNCSICKKLRCWPAVVKPDAFRLLAGAEALSLYQFGTKTDEHFFCKHCGVRSFGTGNSPRWGRFYGVNVTCLDDVTDQELAATPVTYLDGHNDRWDSMPMETGYL